MSATIRSVRGRPSKEGRFRREFQAALDAEVTPALAALGFDARGIGGYSLQWSDPLELATNIRESKWNELGAGGFEVLFSIWMIEAPERWVRGIWLPVPRQWIFDTPAEMEAVGSLLLEGILGSALPLAAERWGAPASMDVAAVAADTDPEVARWTGDWHVPAGQS